jgi:beta-lactamase regulating signal transducer with metallopeptidase domain
MTTMPTLLTLLGWLVDATMKGSVAILLIASAQRLIGRRVGARWRHALWLVVVLRLVVPIAPSSSWSIFNLLPTHPAVSLEMGRVLAHSGLVPSIADSSTRAMQVFHAPLWIVGWRWLAGLWICGIIALVARALIATMRIHRAVRRAARASTATLRKVNDIVDEGRRQLRITRPVRVIETALVDAPALHGVFRPTLLLPEGLSESFDHDELRHVVLHELWHLRRHDVAVNWLLAAVQALHWFNPLVWFAVSRIEEERELACDELTLSCLEEDERFGYGRTILKLLERFRSAGAVPALVGIVNHKQKMKRRLMMITGFRNRSRFSIPVLAALAVVCVVGFTDARGGEHHVALGKLDPAAAQTFQRLDQRVTFDLTNGSFSDLLNTVANKSGVAVTQSPDIATSAVQQAKFTLHAENVPLHAVLMEALMPFDLAPEPNANGVNITKGPSCVVAMHHQHIAAAGATDVVEKEVHVMHDGAHNDAHNEMFSAVTDDTPAGPGQKRIVIHASGPGECKLNADGSLHRELTLSIQEDGAQSQGKLTLDITGVKTK